MTKVLEKLQLDENVVVEQITQDDYDEGLQTIYVKLSNGESYKQIWYWTEYTHASFYKMIDLRLDDEAIYLIMRDIATQTEGYQLWFYGCEHYSSRYTYGKYKVY